MSDLDLSRLREIAEAAHDHIGKLCTGEDRWRMTVPPRDDDSDMLFSTLADGVLALLDRIEELEVLLGPVVTAFAVAEESRVKFTDAYSEAVARAEAAETELAEFREREAENTVERSVRVLEDMSRQAIQRTVGPWVEVDGD